jgi:rubrerythrin
MMSKESLVKMLEESIIAEQTAGDFYRYIAKKIKNNNIRNRFIKFGDDESEKHKKLLNDRLKLITSQHYTPDFNKLDTEIKVSSFSLIGALNMAKESERKAIEFYKEASKKDTKHKKMYNEIIAEEKKHWTAIGQERHFQQEKEEFYSDNTGVRLMSLLMQFCR